MGQKSGVMTFFLFPGEQRCPLDEVILPGLFVGLALVASTSTTGPQLGSEGPPYEISALPVVAFDSSSGLGLGMIANIAHFEGDIRPYDWRLRGQGYISIQDGPNGESEYPLQHHYLTLDLPQLFMPDVRGRVIARYRRRSNAGFFGLGNQTQEEALPPQIQQSPEKAFRYYQYDLGYAELSFSLRLELSERIDAFADIKSWFVEVNPYPDSLLAMMSSSSDLVGINTHGVGRVSVGALYDTRDDETSPRFGVFHEASIRGAKNIGIAGSYAGVNLTGRGYYSLYEEYLVLAGRLMFDALAGDAPLYELARHGGLYESLALGDSAGIRGVPNGRYHGKLKVLGNLELRSKLIHYSLLGTNNSIGALVFVDFGRVWSDWNASTESDERGLGLKQGYGGGLRIQFGRTFVIRVDSAWSPDGRGFYVNVNHIF